MGKKYVTWPECVFILYTLKISVTKLFKKKHYLSI